MDTIAVVGASDRALALLARLAESRFEVVSVSTIPERIRIDLRRRLPPATRAAFLREARFESDLAPLLDCSVVVDAIDSEDEPSRARALAMFEAHMSEGAVLASVTRAPEIAVSMLARPTQFVRLTDLDRAPTAEPVDATAPGALFAVERLCTEIASRVTSVGTESGAADLAEAG